MLNTVDGQISLQKDLYMWDAVIFVWLIGMNEQDHLLNNFSFSCLLDLFFNYFWLPLDKSESILILTIFHIAIQSVKMLSLVPLSSHQLGVPTMNRN